jgi:uncharacterized protein with PIN domain
MATYLVDASALLKRYHAEDLTDEVNQVLEHDRHEKVALEITVVETFRNLHRVCNEQGVPLRERRELVGQFARDLALAIVDILDWSPGFAVRAEEIAEQAMLASYPNGKPSPIDLVIAGCAIELGRPGFLVLSCDHTLNQLLAQHGVPTEPSMP